MTRFSVRASTAAALAGLVAVSACGGGGAPPAPEGDPPVRDLDASEPERDGGRDARTDASADAGTPGNPDGPVVTVLSPAATEDVNSEDVVASGTVTVQCEAKKNPKGERVDPASVKVSIYAGTESKAAVTQNAVSKGEDVFEAQNIDLSAVPHGSIRIQCEASDLAVMAERSTESITTLHDKGPQITFLSPAEKGYVPAGVGMGEDVRVRFRVAPQPLGDDDTGAEVDEIKATVGGKPITKIDPSTTEDNVYSFGLDFSDTQMFTVIPDALSVRVEAKNRRQPEPRVVSQALSAGVDSEGPVITVLSPVGAGGQLPVVSGRVSVTMNVKDALAGVNRGSVFISISAGGMTKTEPATPTGVGDTFVAIFETGSYPDRPTLDINISATDNAGIVRTSNLKVDIDTVPPWISMDPPTVRELFPMNNQYLCTGSFAPLGEDVVKEGKVVGSIFRPRVLIWDRALVIGTDQRVARYAMTDLTSARLYVQHHMDVPLLVDTDKDARHECDQINQSENDVSKKPTTLVLTAVGTQGQGPLVDGVCLVPPAPDLTPDPSAVGACAGSISGKCVADRLGSDTTMTRIIRHTAPGNHPVVFADSPTAAGDRSTGTDYVAADPGWQCLVAVAKDNAGNFAFSEPLRVCLEFKGVTCDSTPPASLTCTDGCVIPGQFLRDAPNRMPRLIRY